MKILIFGVKGWLGSRYFEYFSKPGFQTLGAGTDITDAKEVASIIRAWHPDVVINAAAKTHGWGMANIDGCEVSEEAKKITGEVNIKGPFNIAKACVPQGIRMVHLSSGCIFDGYPEGGFTEEDQPVPKSWYSTTKASADQTLRLYPGVLILRIRMPMSAQVHPRNLITKLTETPRDKPAGWKREIIDVLNSCTIVEDLLPATHRLIERQVSGIFNVVNPGLIGNRRIMEMYCDIVDPGHRGRYVIIDPKDYPAAANRPNCSLSTKKLEETGIVFSNIELALRRALLGYREEFESSKKDREWQEKEVAQKK